MERSIASLQKDINEKFIAMMNIMQSNTTNTTNTTQQDSNNQVETPCSKITDRISNPFRDDTCKVKMKTAKEKSLAAPE